jgi:hypothetical protein
MLQRDIQSAISEFAQRLTNLIETDAMARARDSVLRAFTNGGATPRRGRPPRSALALSPLADTKPRRRRAKVFCPVPGCKNVAAPVFGMVCGKHKDVPKAQIKKYRAARRAKAAAAKA